MTEGEIGDEFEAFRRMIVRVLVERGCYGCQEDVAAAVDQRVFQFLSESEELFLFTRPSHSLGYYLYQDGREVMTYRDPLSESEACAEIQTDFPSALCTALFRVKARGALVGVVRDCLDVQVRAAAQEIADRWFPSADRRHPVG